MRGKSMEVQLSLLSADMRGRKGSSIYGLEQKM